MTLDNPTKNTASFSNQTKSSENLIWNDANSTWDELAPEATWDNPIMPLTEQTKNTATFVNLTKN